MIIGDATKRRQDRLDLEKRRKQKSLKSGSALPSPPEDFLDDNHLETEDVDDDLDSDDDSNDDEDDSDDELTHWVIPQVKRLNKGNTHRRKGEHPYQGRKLNSILPVDFSQSRIGVKKCVFNKRTIKVCAR